MRQAMDETDETQVASVGEQLRAAREAKGLSLEDIAAQTRIPRRHLESLEAADWENLPASTYTIGFAKSYAASVGLDRATIGDQLRAEMGGTRASHTDTETYEAADPARTMPKWLVLAAIAAVAALVIAMSWLNNRSLEQPEEAQAEAPAQQAQATPAQPQATPAAQQAAGPVVLSATEPAWIQVSDQGRTLFEGMLNPGQNFPVPQNATAPLLKAGKPEALRITVGTALAPPVGPAGRVASNISLRGPDLMRGGQSATAAPAAAPAPPTNR
jgi:cytoskeletal protein RodZ